MSNNSISSFLTDVFYLLNNSTRYAVLRNYEGLPMQAGRDIDLIISPESFHKQLPAFIAIVERHGFRIIVSDRRQFMHFFGLGRVIGTDVELISFDFIFTPFLKGYRLMSADEILDARQFNGQIYHVRCDHEFLSKYLYNKILGSDYPDKYNAVRDKALMSYSKEIEQSLRAIWGEDISSVEVVESLSSSRLYGRFKSQLRRKNIVLYYSDIIEYMFCQLRRILCPKGFSIGFTGPDGVGKTTIIGMTEKHLKQLSSVTIFHHRPTLIGNLSNVVHQAGLKRKVDDDYSRPHRGGKHSAISSLFRLMYYSVDYIVGFYAKVLRRLFNGGFVIFDRYYTDIVCDAQRSGIYLPVRFLHIWGRIFIPSLDYNILLTASTDTILKRKQELDREGVETINRKIDYLADKAGYYKIMNEGTPQEAVAEILHIILEVQHKKNIKRI